MTSLRAAAVAGLFYPAAAGLLRADIAKRCSEATPATLDRPPRILILPHAGYVYSASVAAAGYRLLTPHEFEYVVVLCPAHRVYLKGMAIPSCEAFSTPLGTVPLDMASLEAVSRLPGVLVSDEAHRFEHAIEVQLPFLQQCLEDFSLLPVVVGDTPAALVADLIETVMTPRTLLIVSTDLSHYLTWAEAREVDANTLGQILKLDNHIQGEQACGCYGLNGALLWARRHDLQATLLAKANSGDTAGDKSRVVGYGAVALY